MVYKISFAFPQLQMYHFFNVVILDIFRNVIDHGTFLPFLV